MAAVKQLLSMADLEAVVAESAQHPVLVFKHSTTWPISANAHRAWAEFLNTPEAGSVGLAWVRVIEERPVSLAFADQVGAKHASPQAVLVKNGQAVWHDSHWNITVDALKAATKKA
jgi:bacillithiol system protein YtxJ